MMRTRPVLTVAPLSLTLLLAILTISCSIFAPSAQELSNQTATAALSALNAGHTATVDAAHQQATADLLTATVGAAQTEQSRASTATALAGNLTATANSALGDANAPGGWKLAFYDPFESSDARWPLGDVSENQFNHLNQIISEGKYVWKATARQGFVEWAYLSEPSSVMDFFVTVDGKLESGEPSAGYGIVARVTGSNSFYEFVVTEQKRWTISVIKNDIWNTLRGGTSQQIVTGGNHLAASGVGGNLTFYVNGAQIARVADDRIGQGGVGVIMEMGFRGATATVSFDNFTVLTP